MESALHAEIELRSDDSIALTPEQRAEAMQSLTVELLAAERLECAICEATGALCRSDADARAVLGVM
jgi:hypothetical protein